MTFIMLIFFYIGLCHYFPPTMIPDIEPTPLPSTGVWNQPEELQPEYSDATSAFIDGAPSPRRTRRMKTTTWLPW